MAHLESLRFHFNLILASLKTPANHSENGGTGQNGTGGSAAPREPAKPKNPSKNKGRPLYTPQKPCRKHQGCSIISQYTFHLFSKNKIKRQGPRARDHRSTNQTPEPIDRITHAVTMEISRFWYSPPNLRYDTRN